MKRVVGVIQKCNKKAKQAEKDFSVFLCGSEQPGSSLETLDLWALSIVWKSKYCKTQLYRNWICFRLQLRGETPIVLGPLEKANLNHWLTLYCF
jgi:hypothetical protein